MNYFLALWVIYMTSLFLRGPSHEQYEYNVYACVQEMHHPTQTPTERDFFFTLSNMF